MQYIHTMEYYVVFKNEENPVTCYIMDELEDIMLSEISQLQNNKYCMIPLV